MKVCELLKREPLPIHTKIRELIHMTWDDMTFSMTESGILLDNGKWQVERMYGMFYHLWVSEELNREVEELTGPEKSEQFIIDMFNDHLSEKVTALLPKL
jgi:hypothetical protein